MLTFLVLLGFALLAAGVYKALDSRREHADKLARVRREIAAREAAAARRDMTDTTSEKDPS